MEQMEASSPEETVDGAETEEEMRKRHKAEVRQLEGKTRALLKKAPKPKKAEVQGEVARMERDMEERHARELGKFAAAPNGGRGKGEEGESEEEEDGGATAAEKVARKRDKARRKKERKAEREAEEEAARALAKEGVVSLRDLEMGQILSLLSPLGLRVQEVPADGHCLYRAVAHQLEHQGIPSQGYPEVRRSAAQYILSHPEDFLPFLAGGEEGEAAGLEAYVHTVEDTAEWGGELEIRALAFLRVGRAL
ncbi:otu domain-containing protein 6b [Nannochloropsis gaditana CCMP526]|uniref:otu domain-containing protein 6b n=1 Tax=Nannochloropsis gaditana (strain CCMP526) TaxID=1093141 RepID=UPI00029F7A1A|nr:otu domain-containing protein 6b [Nannochloropsis gaditana CCMP526]EKU21722.1 otu domain-containing protein 6b [Nannochloropsis gaditana CCMP526]|eukprot:XP_005854635.1 otu domain-containing protein 6b [Nannochloropsis gaditana CCMP526]